MVEINTLKATKDSSTYNSYNIEITNEGNDCAGNCPILLFSRTDHPSTHTDILRYYLPYGADIKEKFDWGTRNIYFDSDYNEDSVCNITFEDDLSNILKARLSIKDTDFPPPEGFFPVDPLVNVDDVSANFTVKEIEITKNASTTSHFDVKITLVANAGTYRSTDDSTNIYSNFQDITFSTGNTVKMLIFNPTLDGMGSNEFHIKHYGVDFSAPNVSQALGVPILLVSGYNNGDIITSINPTLSQNSVQKKGLILIK